MTSQSTPDQEQSFIAHLLELRTRLLRMVLGVLVLLFGLLPFASELYNFFAQPMIAALPPGAKMQAIGVASPFLTPFKLSLIASLFLAMPFLLYQLWGFVAPGLYRHERRLAFPLISASILLFYVGMAFAYFVVFPLVFKFFTAITPEGIENAPDIAAYLDFMLTLFFAFGVAFQVPIATIVLVLVGATTPENLRHKRPYVIVGAFVIGMLLTPPDMISQTLLAFPMWFLFELGIIFSSMFVRRRKEAAAASGYGDDEPEDAEVADGDPDKDPDGGGKSDYQDDFQPLTEEEMEAELDAMDDDDEEDDKDTSDADDAERELDEYLESQEPGPHADDEVPPPESAPKAEIDLKIRQANIARDHGALSETRRLLYEVLEEGDEDQVRVARNILAQLDE